jgi:hypothetical protein
LFRAATVPGILPSEPSPRRRSRTSLEAAGFLAVIHRRAGTRRLAPCYRWFPATSTLSRSCRDPPPTMSFLSPSRGSVPGHSGHRTTKPLRSVSFTYFEAFFPSSSPFAAASGRPLVAGRCSPGFSAPSELSPPTPRILHPPRTITALNTRSCPKARTCDPKDQCPLEPGEAFPGNEMRPENSSSADSSPLRDWPAPPRRR